VLQCCALADHQQNILETYLGNAFQIFFRVLIVHGLTAQFFV